PATTAATTRAHLAEDRIESFSWNSSGAVDRQAFERVLRQLPSSVLRAKGFLRGPDERTAWLFQVVCGRVEMTAFEGGERIAGGVQGVFIGPGVSALRDGIVAQLAACGSTGTVAG
ncbi:MAG: GTP-binding protein, partial [Candidatus Binatia bacterium]